MTVRPLHKWVLLGELLVKDLGCKHKESRVNSKMSPKERVSKRMVWLYNHDTLKQDMQRLVVTAGLFLEHYS